MIDFRENEYDSIVIGGGHAGVESALALSRLGNKTLLLTLTPDSISYMACNPSIGGTAKGHLVREIDALGGQMGLSADKNLLQLRMLNLGKGTAVHSLRGQADKISYHLYMKNIIENQKNLTLLQAEVKEILVENNCVNGVVTTLGNKFYAKSVVLCCGVYLNSSVIIGDWRKDAGPSGFERATFLTENLQSLGLSIRRFKTGTPARVNKNSLDFSKMQIQNGDEKIYPFSFLTKGFIENKFPCYLTYTNEKTHNIIKENIARSPLYNGSIKSTGPRYCPSIEDKVMRFVDKDRHQIFVEPESAFTNEMYVQGMSSSMPYDVQLQMYRSIEGMEKVEIIRFAYAIEYDCLDSTQLNATLMVKHIKGLFCAGQINGSSGYEEAGAQGLIAGINANLYNQDKEGIVLGRDEAYIGVLIDDLVTKGTNEPYRMMTARAEYRLNLRQENADLRLSEKAIEIGLASEERINNFNEKKKNIEEIQSRLDKNISPKVYSKMFEEVGENYTQKGMTYREMLKRTLITSKLLMSNFEDLKDLDERCFEEVETLIKYEGYLQKQQSVINEAKKLENKRLDPDIDYSQINGLRLEARQKLDKIKPINLGQASRISGVSPADITVLLVYLQRKNK